MIKTLHDKKIIPLLNDYSFEEQQVYTSFVEKEEETKGMLNSIKNFGLSAWNILTCSIQEYFLGLIFTSMHQTSNKMLTR